METDDKTSVHDPKWENRELCPYGNCIGIIGPDGRCKECGMPSGNPQKTADMANDPECSGIQAPESDPEWENRILCPDGNCIGIIGPDGRCRVCGKEG